METKEDNRAEEQASGQLDSIVEMVDNLNNKDTAISDDARESIQEDPLSIEVRSDWHSPGKVCAPSEFNILLCTGGPAVRIIGDLDEHGQPENPRLEYQDWFTQWQEYIIVDNKRKQALQIYCEQFYFGE